MQTLLVQNNQETQIEFAGALHCSQKIISNQLRALGKVKKFGNWFDMNKTQTKVRGLPFPNISYHVTTVNILWSKL